MSDRVAERGWFLPAGSFSAETEVERCYQGKVRETSVRGNS